MTASFFQHYWRTVGKSVVRMIWSFFDSGFSLRQINYSFIALIPKTNSPSRVEQFRPIALCKVCYKIIANRLKTLLPKIISTTHSAFVLDRMIQDNLISASEIMHSMSRKKGRSGLMALKMDMAQAYDCLEWPSILHALRCFGFSSDWIQLIS